MFLRLTTTILLVSIKYLLAVENSTTTIQPLEPSDSSTTFGNTTTRETETTEVQSASNYVTERIISNAPNQLPLKQKQKDDNFLSSRGKTKFTFENIVQASSNHEPAQRIETIQSNYHQLTDLQRQKLQRATLEKEQFIQSELHNLAKDIAETELNFESGKTNSKTRPSTWKSFFSSIFPQGILNVFHLSVSTEPQKSKEFPGAQVKAITKPNSAYTHKTIIAEWSTLPITPSTTVLTPPTVPQFTEDQPQVAIVEPKVATVSETETMNGENQRGSVMTNKDVFDINGAAEVSEVPFEAVIPMESSNVFRIHPLNCEGHGHDEELEDYADQFSETGDDNVVAYSRESPNQIFYPTPKPLPYEEALNNFQNTDIYYSGTGTQTSEEIIRENTKDFGKKMIPYHPAKQLDDFQKEVEKKFDHNEVRIDSEEASRKFLKDFKGKYVKPPQSSNSGQSSSFKGINHFELVSSTLTPEITFQAEPERELHTSIFSSNTDSGKPELSSSMSNFNPPQNAKVEIITNPQIMEEKPPSSNVPYPNALKPDNLLHTYIFSIQTDNKSVNSISGPGPMAPKGLPMILSWGPLNKNSNAKENSEIIPNQINSGNLFYPAEMYNNEGKPRNEQNKNENNMQGINKGQESLGLYSTNLKPESLLHTYIFSAPDKNNNNSISNADSGGIPKPEANFPPWMIPKQEKQGQELSSFKPTQTTYLCSQDQLKSGDCSFSTASPADFIQIQKSLEQQEKHSKPFVYYSFPAGPPLLSKNPIRVAQSEDSQQSETYAIPESYQQRQQYLQDHQKQLNEQQEFLQQQEIHQYQQKLQYQQQQQYRQKQIEQMQKQQEQLKQYQQRHHQQLLEYQQAQQQQREQQQQEMQKQQQQKQQQLQEFLQVQQQQRNQEQLHKEQHQVQQYQQDQEKQRAQQQFQQEMQKQQEEEQLKEKRRLEPQKQIIEVEKIVPKPYPVPVKEIVEKIVERRVPVPVERIVEKPVNVPYPVREVVEKIVDRPYPVEKIVDRPVHIPYPVQVDHFIDRPYAVRVPVAVAVPVPVHQYIDRPYPVEKIVEKPIHVPYPVDKVVEKIIEKHIPVEVERIVEKPAPKKNLLKKTALKTTEAYVAPRELSANKNKSQANNLEELLELVPPPVDQHDHESYKTIPEDIEFILLDDYNGPVPADQQQGYPWNKPEKRAVKNHQSIKRSPEFRRNLRVEYGFRPPLIPSVEIGEKGLI